MPISRRQFLTGSLAAFAAVVGARFLTWPKQDPVVASHKPGHEEFAYRGRRVVIEETERAVSVMIDGVHQHHIVKNVPRRGRFFFASHLMPFENFNSAADLTRQLIDLELDMELFALT